MIKLFYFSGTGNSLFVTQKLAMNLGAEYISIAQLIDQDKIDIDADTVGLIFPIHYIWNGGIPEIVKRFISRITDLSEKYIFAVCTNGGGQGDSLLKLQKLLAKKKGVLYAGFSLRFHYNYIDGIGKLVENKIDKTEHINLAALKKIERISYVVKKKNKVRIDRDSIILLSLVDLFSLREKLGKPHYQKYSSIKNANCSFIKILPYMDDSFNITSECNVCEICIKVCPVNNIMITGKGPEYLHHCEQCFACLQYCPKSAIQFGSKTIGMSRYTNKNVTLSDMIKGSKKA